MGILGWAATANISFALGPHPGIVNWTNVGSAVCGVFMATGSSAIAGAAGSRDSGGGARFDRIRLLVFFHVLESLPICEPEFAAGAMGRSRSRSRSRDRSRDRDRTKHK